MNIFITTIMPWFWIGILVLMIIIESITFSLTTIWAAIAAIPVIFLSRTSLDFRWQLLIFALLTLVLAVFTRPFAVKKLKIGRNRTNVNTMEGQEVIVVKKISKFQKGEVKASNGVIWTASCIGEDELEKGISCIVCSVQGNTLEVKKSEHK